MVSDCREKYYGDEIPTVDCGWVYRCKQFFKKDGIEEERKVELAYMHLYDQALVWHQQYVKKYGDRTPWEMYEGEVVKRFGAIYEDPIVDLKNLKQKGFVQQYQEAFVVVVVVVVVFEALLNRVELNKAYIVSLYIGCFKKEVSMPIRMFKITNLTDVYAMAKMQEATNAIIKPRYNSSLLPTPKFVSNSVSKTLNAPAKSTNVNGINQNVSRTRGNRLYRLTQKELEEKGGNQSFYCDQKYFPGHKCSGQLHSLEVVGENE
ncbi:retrovirus-related pol polyprotein from transposon 17.6 [Tanacetum coccineum]